MADLYLILQHDDPISLQTACGLLATATSMGRAASVFLTFGALWSIVHDELDEGEPTCADPTATKHLRRARDSGSLASPSALLAAARETGEVRLYACSASWRILQLGPEHQDRVDAILGLAAFLGKAEGNQLLVL